MDNPKMSKIENLKIFSEKGIKNALSDENAHNFEK
jgi:hypothetical protein